MREVYAWLAGPSLRFHVDTVAALTGADFEADVDGSAVPLWTSILIKSGSVLTVGKVSPIAPYCGNLPSIQCHFCQTSRQLACAVRYAKCDKGPTISGTWQACG